MEINSATDKFFKNPKSLFWFFNSLFWFVHWTINIISYPKILQEFIPFIIMTSGIIFGFMICFLLRFIFKKYNWIRYSLIKLTFLIIILAFLCSFLWYIWDTIFIFGLNEFQIPFTQLFIKSGLLSIFLSHWYRSYAFVTWSALYFGYKLWIEWNEQKLRTVEEHAQLKSAQLEMLRYQLNPHFLFNTLSSVEGMIEVDTQKAKAMIIQISEFLRYSLFEGAKGVVSLTKEINIIKNYLGIEKIRYQDNLIVEYNIDPQIENYPIPVFLIHPLIENAIKHGMATSPMPLRIVLNAILVEDNLKIEVFNSGRWIEDSNRGIGLQNIQKRLEHSYPNNHSFEIIKNIDSVQIIIRIKKVV
jgi:two-component system, LytTR family, sensor kinase